MTAFFVSRGKVARFKKGQWLSKVKQLVSDTREEATRDFLRELQTNVPVYEGTARGTMIPIGRLVNEVVDTDPTTDRPIRSSRGAEAGAAQASARFYGNQYVLGFQWEHDLRHYEINEQTANALPTLRHPTPWYSIKKSQQTFEATWRGRMSEMPSMSTDMYY